METGALTAAGINMLVPLYRYVSGGKWEVVSHTLASPLPDGTVAYYQDSLSKADPLGRATGHELFDDSIGRALCRYVQARVIRSRLDVADGPYIQILEEDGSVPPGWIMLRAIVWTEEFDLMVPVSPAATAGELVSP